MEVREGAHSAADTDPDDADASTGTGTYVLRDLIRDIPLAQDDGTNAHITCVDAWRGNLYVGTSAGEVLHYVAIPPDPADASAPPSYIFATRLAPPFSVQQDGAAGGVKQILLLPDAGKACILCNATYSFYTLPELSPAFGGKVKQAGCLWVGGIDNNEVERGQSATNGTVVVICLKQRLRVIRIGEEARRIRDIELGGVTALQRRGDLACVADGKSYALLDVVNQRKIQLFPISTSTAPEPRPLELEVPDSKSRDGLHARSFSAASPVRQGRPHERNISLGTGPKNADRDRLRPDSSSPWPARDSSKQTASPAQPSSRKSSPTKAGSAETSARSSAEVPREPEVPVRPLPPNIVSPSSNEFLLTTGTKADEPGVGMFVNLDGDVVRGTIEFSTYPECLVIDSQSGSESSGPDMSGGESYVLAIVSRTVNGAKTRAIETQKLDADSDNVQSSKQWLNLGAYDAEDSGRGGTGLRLATSATELSMSGIGESLRLRRLHTSTAPTDYSEADAKRNEEEDRFASRFAQVKASVLLYHDSRVSWVTRNPLLTRLEKQLDGGITQSSTGELAVDVTVVQRVINSIRGQDAKSELEFLTLTYIRQKASLLLFGNLVLQTASGTLSYEHDKRRAEDALLAGEIDPRIILSLVPPLADEIDEGAQGIWAPQGLCHTITQLRTALSAAPKIVQDPQGAYGDNLLQLTKRYLLAWRAKKGFGSIADEAHVFRSVDAALLHALLLLDQATPRGPAAPGTVRAELNDVVDRGVDCFARAAQLFERFGRLYMLSRLYQSRKLVAQVLATWKRIVEGDGETDAGGELVDAELDLRRYLAKLRDAALVREYGGWLAQRNPRLGVQVFADDNSRVTFTSEEAMTILRAQAPGAVKVYLEHLVFAKNDARYVHDLIAYYLDAVLAELASPAGEARAALRESYASYRALRPPKPTYAHFITAHTIQADWWHSRLRLLQLLGGGHGAAAAGGGYDGHALALRLAPWSEELVPEMIILNWGEGRHGEALRLLVHGLGDYDSAVRYCLRGGAGIFHPAGGVAVERQLSREEQAALFAVLLHEFFAIGDAGQRVERTAELLERFGGWFDVAEVLEVVPDGWSVEVVAGFLVPALRRLVGERNETDAIKRATASSAVNMTYESIAG
ncbi:hypothetical protein LTR08_006416 [Meristemomyces frigidus]|nr:hypothetical protein LTR08_006416 [Meristemomyces frigidus]